MHEATEVKKRKCKLVLEIFCCTKILMLSLLRTASQNVNFLYVDSRTEAPVAYFVPDRNESNISDILDKMIQEEALDRTMWRNHFGRGVGPVVRQITE